MEKKEVVQVSLVPEELQQQYKNLSLNQKIKYVLCREGKRVFGVDDVVKDLITKSKKLEAVMDKKVEEAKVVGTPEVKKDVEVVKVENGKREMTLQDTMLLGEQIYKSRYFNDIQSAAQATAKILRGREIGLAAMTSIENIYIVNGRTSIMSNIMAGEIKRSGKYDYKIEKQDNNECDIVFYENGKLQGHSVFTIKDAERAGLLSKSNWKNYPSDCLFARAMSRGKRRYCPDVCMGVYDPEELDIDVAGYTHPAPDFQIEGVTKFVEAEVVKPEKKEEKKSDVKEEKKKEAKKNDEDEIANEMKSRVECLKGLKEKHGEAKLKEVKKELEILGKIIDASAGDWAKFVKALV